MKEIKTLLYFLYIYCDIVILHNNKVTLLHSSKDDEAPRNCL